MKEKPMLFSTPMVKALLEGRKSMTRRIIKNKDIINRFDIDVDGSIVAYIDQATGDSYKPGDISPYPPGTRIWVKETFAVHPCGNYDLIGLCDNCKQSPTWEGEGIADIGCYIYKADHEYKGVKWKSSMFMPRAAARIWLEVTNVRVERLQEIDGNGLWAEGFGAASEVRTPYIYGKAMANFKNLWDSLNAKPKEVKKNGVITHYESYPWEDVQEVREHRGKPWYVYGNPWLWCYSFTSSHTSSANLR